MSAELGPLRAWLAAHPSADEAVAVVQGGDAQVDPDGAREITMPWSSHTSTIHDLWKALDHVSDWSPAYTADYLDVVDRWRQAHGGRPLDAAQFGAMDRTTLLNALRWYNRGERFCDGLWSSAWKAGDLHAAARALIALG